MERLRCVSVSALFGFLTRLKKETGHHPILENPRNISVRSRIEAPEPELRYMIGYLTQNRRQTCSRQRIRLPSPRIGNIAESVPIKNVPILVLFAHDFKLDARYIKKRLTPSGIPATGFQGYGHMCGCSGHSEGADTLNKLSVKDRLIPLKNLSRDSAAKGFNRAQYTDRVQQ